MEWLSRRVGSSGHVLATDISTSFLDVLDLPNLEVRRHDIVQDDLPEDAFDLVHARLVLTHLAERDIALRRMVKALKPGAGSSSRRWIALPGLPTRPVILLLLPYSEKVRA